MALLFIPYTLYKVECETASQRPMTDYDFAVLELLKQANQQNINGYRLVKSTLNLPDRLLIEIISELMEQGYCALDANDQVKASPLADKMNSIEDMICFSSVNTVTEKTLHLCRENLTGKFYDSSQVKNQELLISELQPNLINNLLRDPVKYCDIGEVRSYLEKRMDLQGEFLTDFQMEIKTHCKGYSKSLDSSEAVRCLVARVESNNILGLPDELRHDLPFLKALKKYYQSSAPLTPCVKPEFSDENILVDPAEFSLLTNKHAHKEELKKALREAKSHILIHSAHCKLAVFDDEIRRLIRSATSRRVTIDIAIGFENDSETSIEQLLNSADLQFNNNPERLRIYPRPTRSDAKLLLYDREDEFVAIVGSYNWLFETSLDKKDYLETSVHICNPLFVAKVLKLFPVPLSEWWHSVISQYEGLKQLQDNSQDAIPLRVLTNRDHHVYQLNLADQTEVIFTSYNVGYSQIVEMLDDIPKLRVMYGKKSAADRVESVENARFIEGMHARIMAENNKDLVVTSYSFLSDQITKATEETRSNNIGVHISDPAIAARVFAGVTSLYQQELANGN